MPKYAPANGEGLKPYCVTVTEWGRQTERIVYAHSAGDAQYQAKGRMRYTYARARRATPEDMIRCGS